MIFKCPECGETLTTLNVVVSNVISFGAVSLFDDGSIDNWDLDPDYDDAIDEYSCPHCDYIFPASTQDQIEKYFKE
jgi:hypothetical protein